MVGYGSIGKRHARNLKGLGIRPYVLTDHPDNSGNAIFVKNFSSLKGKNISHCIIASPSCLHLRDFKRCVENFKGAKHILIEKPLEINSSKARAIGGLAKRNKILVSIGYNLRFLKAFDRIKKFIKKEKDSVRLVEVLAGQDLVQWHPKRDYRLSYSACRKRGGGVDLDLSHEIDYVLWLFGNKFQIKTLTRRKISSLKINSPDYFKLLMDYSKFVVDITLDYIRRPKERYLKIICDNGKRLYKDFTKESDLNLSYLRVLKAFLGFDKKGVNKLCSLKEGLQILKAIRL